MLENQTYASRKNELEKGVATEERSSRSSH